ncbi:MAG: hypothetical protein ACKV2Q_16380 [Planctomycetaceae bacterium]
MSTPPVADTVKLGAFDRLERLAQKYFGAKIVNLPRFRKHRGGPRVARPL